MSLRKSVAANLRELRAGIMCAEDSLERGATVDQDDDMLPAEIIEARTLLSGIRARLALEIFLLEQPPAAPAKASA